MSRPEPLPDDSTTLTRISGAADALERHRAEAQTLAREAELAGTGSAAGVLLLALAELRESRLGDDEGALAALEQARAAAPDDPAILASLRRLALRRWRWPLAADVLAAERKQKNGGERNVLGLQLADVLSTHLGRRDEALAIVLEILEAEPANALALSRALPMWTASAAWSEQTEHLKAAAEACLEEDPPRASSLLYQAAEVYRWRLRALDRAAECLEQAVKADPASGAAVKALGEVASEMGNWTILAGALQLEAELAAKPELASAAFAKLGSIKEDLLADPAGAEAAYRAALEREPSNRTALVALGRIAEAKGDHALRAELLERRLLLTTDVREAIAISLALGSLYEERLGSTDRAANHFQRVLAVTADEAPAFRALGRLMSMTSDWRGLLGLYEREAAETPDPTHRVHCLFKIAELYEEKLGEDGSAISSYRRILQIQPTYLPALRALGRLFQRAQDWTALVELYRNEAAATEDKDHAISLLEKVADIHEEKLSDAEGAAAAWETVLTLAPNHLPALRALGRLFWRRENWAKLVTVNLTEAALTKDPKVVANLLQKTGEVYEERMGLPEDALRCYREALDHVPNYLPAMRSLGRLAASRGAWAEVIKTEEMEAEGTADVRRAASLLAAAAEHYETKLDDPARAMVTYEKVLARVPGYLPAVSGLVRLYRRAGRWADLVHVLEGAIPPMDRDAAAAAAVLVEIANVEGHRLRNDLQAATRIATARSGAPVDLTARREHEEYLARKGEWTELAAVYAADAEIDSPGALRAALYVRLAGLAERTGAAGVGVAAGFYRAALGLEAGNRCAAAGLDAIGRLNSDEAARIEALQAVASHAGASTERRAALVELARVWESAGDAGRASEAWVAASAVNADSESVEAQARLAARGGDSAAASAFLVKALALSAEGPERDRLALEAANSLVDAGEFDRAEAILTPLVGAEPEPTPALLIMERLHQSRAAKLGATDPDAARRSLEGAVDVQRKLAARTRDPARKAELTLRVAEALTGPLGRPADAQKLLEEITATEPVGSGPHSQALALLESLYVGTGDVAGQASILERQADASEGDARAELLRQAGELLRTADIDRAILLWERALGASQTVSPVVLPLLLEAYTVRENWQALLTTWNRVISTTKDPKQAAEAFYRKGLLLQDKLSLPDKAEQHFERALGADPGHMEALDSLTRLLEASGRQAEAREALSKLVARLPPESPDLADLLVRLASLEQAAGDEAAALEHLKQVVLRNPGRLDVHRGLIDLYLKKGDRAGEAVSLRVLVSSVPDPERTLLRRRLAAALDATNDEQGALIEWTSTLKADPDNLDARKAVAAILGRKPASRPEAIQAYSQILRLDPTAIEALTYLVKVYEDLKQKDKSFCLSAILSFAGALGEEQANAWKELLARAPRKAVTLLSAEDRRSLLVHPDARSPVGELIALLGSTLYAGLTFDAPSGATKVIAGDKHPLRARLEAIHTIFDGPEIDMYISREPGAEARVIPGDPPGIMVGMGFPALPPAVQDFLLGRAVFRTATGWPPAARGEHEVRADLWTAAAALDLAEPPPGSDQRRLRAIGKSVTRKQRRDVADLLQAFVAKPQSMDVATFLSGVRRTANRAGLLVAVDLPKAVDAMSFTEADLQEIRNNEASADPFWKRIAAAPLVRELLLFAASDDYFVLRKKLGLAVV